MSKETSLDNRNKVRQPPTPPTKKHKPKKGKGSYSRKDKNE